MSPSQPAAATDSTPSEAARLAGTALALGVVAAGIWFAWLGWDRDHYQVDGARQGPYRTWQVLGCGLSIAAAAVLAYLWVRRVWTIFVLAAAADIGFAVPWAIHAASSDDSGLWAVGLLLLLVGGGIGLLVLLAIVATATPPRLHSDG